MRKSSRRIWYLMPVTWLVAAAVLATALTLMLLFGKKTQNADNTLLPGFVNVKIHENPPPPYMINEDGEIDRVVTVENTGGVPVWIRVQLSGDGVNNFDFDPDPFYSEWEKHGDFWYYTEEVYPGASTVSLFEKLTLKETVVLISPLQLVIAIYAEGVQFNTGEDWGTDSSSVIAKFNAS